MISGTTTNGQPLIGNINKTGLLNFTITDRKGHHSYFWGNINIENNVLQGKWGIENNESDGNFILNL